MKRITISIGVAALVAAIAAAVASIAASTTPPSAAAARQAFTQHLQQARQDGLLTWSAPALTKLAGSGAQPTLAGLQGPASGAPVGNTPTGPGLANVRVNDPSEDSHFLEQTTQSEPTIAVSGQDVVVGFNDSQTALASGITAGMDLTGYAFSSNGGATFTDGGVLPNPPGMNNVGDPWLGTDRAGNIYFSNLVSDYAGGNVDIGVARSTDGGQTFSQPVIASPGNDLEYAADKDALAVGPDPTTPANDDVYVAWDDEFIDQNGNLYLGLPVARSTNQGQTWKVTYADKFEVNESSCSFQQYIGSTPAVAPNGTLYVVAEKASVDDPDCTGENPLVFSEWIFKSVDGGKTFDSGHQIGAVTETGDVNLGPGMVMRNLEFPTIAISPGGNIYVAWNDAATGTSNIRLATSTDGGATWGLSWATSGTGAKVQPALSADTAGLHLLYYQRNPNKTLDVVVANSTNGTRFTTTRVTSQSFPGVPTLPQFDPIIADTYMGDYIANVSSGNVRYFAWGDNRDTVTNVLWPSGRHDPNVYLAKY